MHDIEIPVGKRTRLYRFFEMVPAIISYGAIILLVVLALISPLLAAIYLLLVVVTLLVKAVGIAYHMLAGRARLDKAQKVNWRHRLNELEDAETAYASYADRHHKEYGLDMHIDNLRLIAADPTSYPKPSQLYHAVIMAMYNEPYDVVGPTLQSLIDTTTDLEHMIVVIAYEGRAGEETERTVARLQKEFGDKFFALIAVKHPPTPGEVIGKGGNITYAGKHLQTWLDSHDIGYSQVIVTTLDSDNRPHARYFDYLMYEYIVREDRKRLSYQPVSLFLNNIWDVPAPMRVIATGNSFWNIISSMRPHTLRNFASHSQPMDALVEMNFWSTRTIVEDGHQYWRSYFYFSGNYEVVPLYIPIYQDAVMSETITKTLKAQFIQLRRWAYGASDVPYVAVRVFTKKRIVPFWDGFARFLRLLDGHVTLASVSILVAFGGWVPLLLNGQAYRDVVAHQLPDAISLIQRIALIGLIITIFLAFKMLPPRPERYKRHRTIGMLLQWVLMPVTAIVYSSASAFYSQTRLFFGRYMDRFDVTAKVTADAAERARASQKAEKAAKKRK